MLPLLLSPSFPPPSPPTLPLSSTEICAKPQSRAHTRSPHQRRGVRTLRSRKESAKSCRRNPATLSLLLRFLRLQQRSRPTCCNTGSKGALYRNRGRWISELTVLDGRGYYIIQNFVLMLNGKVDPNYFFNTFIGLRISKYSMMWKNMK